MGFIEIVFPLNSNAIFLDRFDIEEKIEIFLDENGIGEISGGGIGMGNFNIDIDVFVDLFTENVAEMLAELLVKLNAPDGTLIYCRSPIKKKILI
jgi:hypothetical protein